MKEYFVPAKTDIEVTGSTVPTYNGYLSKSYYDGIKSQHYGIDLSAGKYTAIGDGEVIYVNPKSVGGGVVIKHDWSDTHDLFVLYWHGKPLVKKGDKVSMEDYVTNSLKPDESIGSMGKHTHFEIRIVEKNIDFVYYDKYRQNQAVEAMALLKLRDNNIKVGKKLLKYLDYKGINILKEVEKEEVSNSPVNITDLFKDVDAQALKDAIASILQ